VYSREAAGSASEPEPLWGPVGEEVRVHGAGV